VYASKQLEGLCVTDGCHAPATHDKMCEAHRLAARDRDVRKAKKLRDEVFTQYGGYQCNCPGCHVVTPEFMQLDHINNDGAKHRREIAGHNNKCGSKRMHYWLKTNGWPKIVQPMCANCNFAKGHYGACPHAGKPH
jgi:hypothetical protein